MGIFDRFKKKEEEIEDFSNQDIDFEHFDFNSTTMQQNPMQDPLNGTSLATTMQQNPMQTQVQQPNSFMQQPETINQLPDDDMNFENNFNFQEPQHFVTQEPQQNVQNNNQENHEEYYEFDAYEELKKQLDLITSKIDTLLYAVDGIEQRIKILEVNNQNKKIF